MTEYGTLWDASYPRVQPSQLAALRKLGLRHVRYSIDWSVIERQPGQYVWSADWASATIHCDDLIQFYNAGFLVNFDLCWAPAWASDGVPAYQRYETGCWRIDDPVKGPGAGIHYAGTKPEFDDAIDMCNVHPPHIDPDAVTKFATVLGQRYGRFINSWSGWNEPGSVGYWPPSMCSPNISYEDAIARLLNEVVIPLKHAIGAVSSLTLPAFSGPDADTWAAVGECLKQEDQSGLRIYDRISLHPYAWGVFPDHSYERITGEFWPALEPYRKGRPVDFSEIGDDGTGRIAEWTAHVIADAAHQPDRIIFLDVRGWFADWAGGDYTLTDVGRAMQRIMVPGGRRRAVSLKG